MPSEFHNRELPLPFGNPKSRPWYGMDTFWNRPLTFTLAEIIHSTNYICLTGSTNPLTTIDLLTPFLAQT